VIFQVQRKHIARFIESCFACCESSSTRHRLARKSAD
jgi:hypothetical protein